MRSPHCRYMNASQMWDPVLTQPRSWFVRLIYRLWPRQRSVIGASLYPIATRTVQIRNGDLYVAEMAR